MINARLQNCLALPLEELDYQLSPSRVAKDADASLDAIIAASKCARSAEGVEFVADIRYGSRPRQLLDVFRPKSPSIEQHPCLIFIHGGFWQEGAKDGSAFAAETFTQLGWTYVSLGYTLTPDVTLSELTREIFEAVAFIHSNAEEYHIDPERIILSGHSAGGHLAASVITDLLNEGFGNSISGVVLISGVYELAPIAKSYVNVLARISDIEIKKLSPMRHLPIRDIPVHILIGEDEAEAFQVQSDALLEAWIDHVENISICREPGKDHFDILDILADRNSETVKTIQNMVAR